MNLTRNGKLIIPLVTGLASIVAAVAWAGGFPGGLFDVWGPRYTYVGDAESQLLWTPPPPPIVGDAANSVRLENGVRIRLAEIPWRSARIGQRPAAGPEHRQPVPRQRSAGPDQRAVHTGLQ
jgi:hypothetical protein